MSTPAISVNPSGSTPKFNHLFIGPLPSFLKISCKSVHKFFAAKLLTNSDEKISSLAEVKTNTERFAFWQRAKSELHHTRSRQRMTEYGGTRISYAAKKRKVPCLFLSIRRPTPTAAEEIIKGNWSDKGNVE